MECYLALKKDCAPDVCNDVGGSHGYKVEQRKTGMKAYTIWFYFCEVQVQA